MTSVEQPLKKGFTNDLPSKNAMMPSSSKKFISSDDLYRNSSQYQVWSFNSSQLAQMRQSANEKGQKEALKRFEVARASSVADNAAIYEQHGDKLSVDMLHLISAQEEQAFLRFICLQIIQICAHFNMPTQVKATAMAFFRRFYLIHSVMEYRPKNVAYTIVFLAAKLENYFISIESFSSRIPKTKPADILDLEFVVLQTLQFTLLVHHPFRPLWGFFLDFQNVLLHPSPVMYDVSVDTLGRLYDQAKAWLNDYTLISDVSFLFTPPQIALAAFYACDKRITERYLRLKFLELASSSDQDLGVIQNPTLENQTQELNQSQTKMKKQQEYDLLVREIEKCIVEAQRDVASSREESAKIDERCFFILSPAKLLKKKIKALSAQ